MRDKKVGNIKKIIIILLIIAILFSVTAMIIHSSTDNFKIIKSQGEDNAQGGKTSGNVNIIIEPRVEEGE